MNPTPDNRRVVVVHGPPGDDLSQVLTRSGLVPVVDTGDTTIWAPPPPPAITGAPGRDPALLLDVVTAARRLGIGRTSIYRLIEDGQLEVVHVGRSARIPADAIDDLVDRLRYRNRRHGPLDPGGREGRTLGVGSHAPGHRRWDRPSRQPSTPESQPA